MRLVAIALSLLAGPGPAWAAWISRGPVVVGVSAGPALSAAVAIAAGGASPSAWAAPASLGRPALTLAPSLGLLGTGMPDVPRVPEAKPVRPSEAQLLGWYSQLDGGAPRELRSLDAAARQALYDRTALHPVARLDALDRYDPQGAIGFCFGRAMAAHLLARRLGLAPDGIRKLFIIGDLRSGDAPEWRFHVTLLVRGEDGGWYAIDPIMPGPMPVKDWILAMRRGWDRPAPGKAGQAKLYLTPASAVLPDVSVVPEPGQESGSRVIELSFEPKGDAGFTRLGRLDALAFEVSAEAAERRFAAPGDGSVRFEFQGITINGERTDYRGYFADLFADLLVGSLARALGPLRRSPAPGLAAGAAPQPAPRRLYSPRWPLRASR